MEQIAQAGGKEIRCERPYFNDEMGVFSFEHELTTWLELRPLLDAAGVCI